MFYRRYTHQNINLLLNEAANLCLYDQTYAVIGCWQHNLLSDTRNTKRFREIWEAQQSDGHNLSCTQSSELLRALSPSLAFEAAGAQRITGNGCLLLITLNLHVQLFHWTLPSPQLTVRETHFPSSYLMPTVRKSPPVKDSTRPHVSHWVYIHFSDLECAGLLSIPWFL